MENKTITTTPNAEVKAPANTAATATSAAEKIAKTTPPVSAAPSAPATAPAMTAATAAPAPEQSAATTTPAAEKIVATTPPATATTPTTTATPESSATSTAAPATTTSATSSASIPATTTSATTLSADYLKSGYFLGEGKGRYTDPDLVGQAEEIGKTLAESNIPPAVLNKMVRTLKAASRLPYPAQQGALKKLTPQVLDLENKKKAPPLLRQIVERNQRAVQNEADFAACLDHFKDIGIYLTAAKN